jgi:hypothetical protein
MPANRVRVPLTIKILTWHLLTTGSEIDSTHIYKQLEIQMKYLQFKTLATAGALVLGTAVIANASSDKTDVQLLQQELQALQQRVESLEALKPTFTSLMPNFSERFHVMHRAGEAGDWAVAGHELAEMKRMAAMSNHIDPEKSTLMQGMLGPSFDALGEAIEHGNHEKFETALGGTISACNACHVASESPFIKVTLDARDAINLRHPHVLSGSNLARGHSHGAPAMMQENMQGMMKGNSAQEEHHDETGADGHHD